MNNDSQQKKAFREANITAQPSGNFIIFNLRCRVPKRDWQKTKMLGFRESDLPEMISGMIHDLSDFAPSDPETNREMSN